MSVTNMPQRSAHSSQYSSENMDHNMDQMMKVRRVLFAVPMILLFALVFLTIKTYITEQNNQIKMSADNYQPLVISQPARVTKQLLPPGGKVVKNQPLLSLEVLYEQTKSAVINFNSPEAGYFFHAKTNNNVVKAYQPIGYLLKNSDANEFSFLIKNKPANMGSIGDQVKITVDDKTIFGKVSMVIGSFSKQEWQKIFIKFNNEQYLSLLSPDAKMSLELVEEQLTN